MKRHLPLASHSYFSIHNKDEQKKAFISNDSLQPIFTYHEHFDFDTVSRRIDKVDEMRAKESLQLVLTSILLQKRMPESETLQKFRDLNAHMFIVPREEYVTAIIRRTQDFVTPETQSLWKYIVERVDLPAVDQPRVAPDETTFLKYKTFFDRYYQVAQSNDIVDEFTQILHRVGLEQEGWHLRLLDDFSPARVNHVRKNITVGKHYTPRTSRARHRIVVHEVIGHALRGPQQSIAESEGVAVLLEQLLDERFKFRRTYRYVAAALGWGVLGEGRTFRDVYEIIWRLMVIASRYKEPSAKSHAFDECVRVFRGGRPDIAGMVYLKDTVYFASNIAVWNELERNDITYNEFVDIIEGRRKVLE